MSTVNEIMVTSLCHFPWVSFSLCELLRSFYSVSVFCTSSTASFNTEIHRSVSHALIQDSKCFPFSKKYKVNSSHFEAHSLALWLNKFVFIKTLFPQQTALCSTSRCLLLRSHNYCDSQPIIQQVEMNALLQLCCRFNWGSKLMSKSNTLHHHTYRAKIYLLL